MTTSRIPWHHGSWLNPPPATREDGGNLVVEAGAGSDFWETTLYDFQHRSGHALLAAWEDTRAVEVSFDLRGFTELYDQAGLMLWHSPSSWIKAGVEMTDGVLHLGAVVTHDFSDWSLAPVPEWTDRVVTLRASRAHDAVILRACATGTGWRTLRVARFPHATGKQAGPFACAPQRAGFQVTFTRWAHTAPDLDLHVEPPLP